MRFYQVILPFLVLMSSVASAQISADFKTAAVKAASEVTRILPKAKKNLSDPKPLNELDKNAMSSLEKINSLLLADGQPTMDAQIVAVKLAEIYTIIDRSAQAYDALYDAYAAGKLRDVLAECKKSNKGRKFGEKILVDIQLSPLTGEEICNAKKSFEDVKTLETDGNG